MVQTQASTPWSSPPVHPAHPSAHPPWGVVHAPAPVLRHSGAGIVSLALAIALFLFEGGAITFAGIAEATTPGGVPDESPVVMMLGLVVCGGLPLSLAGLGLGITGLVQPQRRRVFGVLGTVTNGALVLTIGLLILLSLAVS